MKITHLDKSPASLSKIYYFIKENEFLLPDPFSRHVSLMEYSNKLNSLGETFVIEESGEVKGLVSGYINDFSTKQAYLQILIFSETIQGKKYGSNLISEFINYTYKCFGYDSKVFLTVDKSNEKAHSIYKHLGFMVSEKKHQKSEK